MENTTLQFVLAEKSKYLTPKDAAKLSEIVKEAQYDNSLTLSATKVYRPLIITLLFWFVPLFAMFNRFYTQQHFSSLIQIALTLLFYPGISILEEAHLMEKVLMFKQSDSPLTVHTICYSNGLFLLVWYLFDGISLPYRIQKGNYRRLKNHITK